VKRSSLVCKIAQLDFFATTRRFLLKRNDKAMRKNASMWLRNENAGVIRDKNTGVKCPAQWTPF
jgi:hypothetical protein